MSVILHGDARNLSAIPDRSMHLVITSPPYWAPPARPGGRGGLRRYLAADDPLRGLEIGAEPTSEAYVSALVDVGREVRRVLRDDGLFVLNLGDAYDGAKSLLLLPAQVALALRRDGWILRSAPLWVKRNAMPEPARDRPTTAHEALFMFSQGPRYYWDPDAVRRSQSPRSALTRRRSSNFSKARATGRNLRTSDIHDAGLDAYEVALEAQLAHVREVRANGGLLLGEDDLPIAALVNTRPYRGAHFAVWPPALVEPWIRAGTSERGCCPACGAPWRRIVERGASAWQARRAAGAPVRSGAVGRFAVAASTGWNGQRAAEWRLAHPDREIGWSPTCSCPPHEPVPCTVLDPFGGSGTTAAVAQRLGRRAIVVELNRQYHPLIHERLEARPVSKPRRARRAA